MKFALFVATVITPHIAPENAVDKKIETNISQVGISEQFMSAPKSPLPKQKLPSDAVPLILSRIAYCESRDRQFSENGRVLRGIVNPNDMGRYQINATHWADEAEELGYNLATEDGNEAMALYLYKKFGTKPWRASQKCWDTSDQAFAGNQ